MASSAAICRKTVMTVLFRRKKTTRTLEAMWLWASRAVLAILAQVSIGGARLASKRRFFNERKRCIVKWVTDDEIASASVNAITRPADHQRQRQLGAANIRRVILISGATRVGIGHRRQQKLLIRQVIRRRTGYHLALRTPTLSSGEHQYVGLIFALRAHRSRVCHE